MLTFLGFCVTAGGLALHMNGKEKRDSVIT